nr:MAG TPA: hypothetical protein [Microviridae sp.]
MINTKGRYLTGLHIKTWCHLHIFRQEGYVCAC